MDNLISSAWDALGQLWRIAIIVGPVVLVIWAMRSGKHVRSDTITTAKTDAEARNDTPLGPISRGL